MVTKPVVLAESSLGVSSVDLINSIRQNGGPTAEADIPAALKNDVNSVIAVGEALRGNPFRRNEFAFQLFNKVALSRVYSAVWSNKFAELKQGILGVGELVEEIFVDHARPIIYNAELGLEREFKRTLPDIRSSYYAINQKYIYPVTVNDYELDRAFTTLEGVNSLVSRVVSTLSVGKEVVEYNMFKYLVQYGILHGALKSVDVEYENTNTINENVKLLATGVRKYTRLFSLPEVWYNQEKVANPCSPSDLYLVIDAETEAQLDVEVLSAAFHMEKADVVGRLIVIDAFDTFNNQLFTYLDPETAASQIPSLTASQLTALGDVKAVLVHRNWFQVYEKPLEMRSTVIGSTLDINYWLHNWMTWAISPYWNGVVLRDGSVTLVQPPATLSLSIKSVSVGNTGNATIVWSADTTSDVAPPWQIFAVQNVDLSQKGIAVNPQGALYIPADQSALSFKLTYVATNPDGSLATYQSADTDWSTLAYNTTITLTKGADVADMNAARALASV